MSEAHPVLALEAGRVAYAAWMEAVGRAPATIGTRMVHLRRFAGWARSEGYGSLDEISAETLDRFRATLALRTECLAHPLAATTRHCRLAAVRLWVRWAVRTRRLREDPLWDYEMPRLPRRLPRAILSVAEVERVLAQPDVHTPMGLRDRAMLEVFYSTGMRRGEVVRLGRDDVDAVRGVVFIREGKGLKDRVVPIGARAILWVRRYAAHARPVLAARRRGEAESSTLFLGARGDRIRPSRLTARMHRYVSAASGKPGSCHVFRHSMATLMHDGGADIRDLQEMLGHAQISTTEIYTHVSVERLRSVHALTHPAEAGRAWLGRRVGGGVAPLLAVPPRRGRLKGPWGAAGGSG